MLFWLSLGMFIVIAGGLLTIAFVLRMTADGDTPDPAPAADALGDGDTAGAPAERVG